MSGRGLTEERKMFIIEAIRIAMRRFVDMKKRQPCTLNWCGAVHLSERIRIYGKMELEKGYGTALHGGVCGRNRSRQRQIFCGSS